MKKSFNKRQQYPVNTLYVGIDIAKKEHCMRMIEGRGGDESKGMFFANRGKGFERMLKRVEEWMTRSGSEKVVVGMEPTACYWKPLYRHLADRGYEVKLVSSLHVKRSKEIQDNSPLKSDPKDALIIADLVRSGKYLDTRITPENIEEVKVLLAHYENLGKDRARWLNRLEQYKAEYFPELDEFFKDMGGVTVRALLRAYPFAEDIEAAGVKKVGELLWKTSAGQVSREKSGRLVEAASRTIGRKRGVAAMRKVVLDILDTLEWYDKQIEAVEADLKASVKRVETYRILVSIPGVGWKTAAAIIGVLGDLRQYDNYRQALKKAGLNMYSKSSGNHRGKVRITHYGRGIIRKMLYMGSLSHAARPSMYFHEKYGEMVERGVLKMKALVAIMRKILKIAFALVRDNRKFDRNWDTRQVAEREESVIRRAKAA